MKYTILLYFLALVGVSPCCLAEFRIATVDVNRVLNDAPEAQAKRKELDQKSAEARKKLEERSKVLQAQEKKLREAKVAEDSKDAEKFRNEAKEFSRFVKDTEEDLKKEFLKFNKTLADKTLKVVGQYAQEKKIDLVLDKSEKGRGPVLFGDTSFDITDEIVKAMNG